MDMSWNLNLLLTYYRGTNKHLSKVKKITDTGQTAVTLVKDVLSWHILIYQYSENHRSLHCSTVTKFLLALNLPTLTLREHEQQ